MQKKYLTVRLEATMGFDSHLDVLLPFQRNDFQVRCLDWQVEVVGLRSVLVEVTEKDLRVLLVVDDGVPVLGVVRVRYLIRLHPAFGAALGDDTGDVSRFQEVELDPLCGGVG